MARGVCFGQHRSSKQHDRQGLARELPDASLSRTYQTCFFSSTYKTASPPRSMGRHHSPTSTKASVEHPRRPENRCAIDAGSVTYLCGRIPALEAQTILGATRNVHHCHPGGVAIAANAPITPPPLPVRSAKRIRDLEAICRVFLQSLKISSWSDDRNRGSCGASHPSEPCRGPHPSRQPIRVSRNRGPSPRHPRCYPHR